MLATLHPGSEHKTMNTVRNGAVHSGQIFSPLLVKIVPQRPRGSVFQGILYFIKLTIEINAPNNSLGSSCCFQCTTAPVSPFL